MPNGPTVLDSSFGFVLLLRLVGEMSCSGGPPSNTNCSNWKDEVAGKDSLNRGYVLPPRFSMFGRCTAGVGPVFGEASNKTSTALAVSTSDGFYNNGINKVRAGRWRYIEN